MGNILVSENWYISIPATFVGLYWVLRILVLKPWGVHVQYAAAIERTKKKREDGFIDFEKETSYEAIRQNPRVNLSGDEHELYAKLKDIVNYKLEVLREKLQKDELNATTVLIAYVWKAMSEHRRINCLTEVYTQAFILAEEADKKWSGSSEKPPFYGLPFSVKSNFNLKGYDVCVGVGKLLEQPKQEDCPFVTHLVNLGAIPFVITNVPQGLMSFSCSNTVYGRTVNPHDLARTPGGSSGGEAALYVAGGSAFGIGSDLAGSLRIPASMCGCVSLKPTQDRFVVTNTHGGVPGRGRLGLSFGFFTSTVEEQISLLKEVIGTESYRLLVPQSSPAELNINVLSLFDFFQSFIQKIRDTKKLKIGYFDNDGFCPPVPSHARVVNETVEKLKSAGHECVRFYLPTPTEAAKLFYKNVMPDNGEYMRSLYDNEKIDDTMKQFVQLLKIPCCVRWLASKILGPISPQLSTICASYNSDIEDLRYTQELTDQYKLTFIEYWKSLEIDALICPAFIVPAVGHKYPSKLATAGFATGLFNMLDLPAGVVPTGKVTSEDDVELFDEKKFPVGINLALKEQRDAAAKSEGLPAAVQIVTLPYEEEVCLKTMQLVENVW